MTFFSLKIKLKQLAFASIIAGTMFGITGRIFAESEAEKAPTNSPQTPANSNPTSESDRRSPSRGFPNNSLPAPNSIPVPEAGAAENPSENPFALNVVRGTSRRSLGDIVKTLGDDNRFQTLIEIIKLAGLDSELGKAEFIVLFAPTEEAFDGLSSELFDQILLPENRNQLVELIRTHFVAGEIKLSDLKKGEFTTLNGQIIRVKLNSSGKEVQLNEVTAKPNEFILTQNEKALIVPINAFLFSPKLDAENPTF